MRFPFAKEGLPFMAVAVLLCIVAWWFTHGRGGAWVWLPRILVVLAVFVIYFFRDPERVIPPDLTLVVSPADGKVIDIRTVDEPSFIGGEARRITIFLSVFNVHVQRSPVSGEVGHYQYHPGGYLVAWHEKASEENERASLGIETPSGRILVRQIAGLIARRIVTYQRPGDRVERGEHIGLIRFGSRVDLFLPLDWAVVTQVGDKVAGGSSVLAHLPPIVDTTGSPSFEKEVPDGE